MVADYFRAFERRPAHVPARVSALGRDPEPARLVNLCLGGACVESPLRPEAGSRVRLELDAPNLWKPLLIAAQVAWVRAEPQGSRFGLRFDFDDARITGWLLDILISSAYT